MEGAQPKEWEWTFGDTPARTAEDKWFQQRAPSQGRAREHRRAGRVSVWDVGVGDLVETTVDPREDLGEELDQNPLVSCLELFIIFFGEYLTFATIGTSGFMNGNGACVEVTVPHDAVMQLIGSATELPCHYKTSVDKNFMLEWRFAPGSTSPDNGKQILYFTNNVLYKPGSQSERLSLLHDPPTLGDASIRLDNVCASDAGTYICEVNNPPDFYGTSSGIIQFIVLICKGTTSVPVGSDASLTCSSSEGVPAPVYSWTHLDSKITQPFSNMVQNEQTGSLLLTNVSTESSGTYQCVASNEYGHPSCQLSLRVTAAVKDIIKVNLEELNKPLEDAL
ncbi:hypothetical protein JD844_031305 [Phrynosoma platyrhinos]|uniref:Ig-like domain-containing protein n=1 Tax=Phrynosoma platyrhinos TaxID=52577 RepID=A0ABQ7T1R5_PHRPL|nr:hypothetical protein JD844_031305 [Phrynosoma platyrhinos]